MNGGGYASGTSAASDGGDAMDSDVPAGDCSAFSDPEPDLDGLFA